MVFRTIAEEMARIQKVMIKKRRKGLSGGQNEVSTSVKQRPNYRHYGALVSRRSKAVVYSEHPYLPWPQGFFFELALVRIPTSPWMVGLLVFVIYWVVPFFSCAMQGTLITTSQLQAFADNFADILWLRHIILTVATPFAVDSGLAYLSDHTHFIFAAILALGAAIGMLILRRINRVVIQLGMDGLPNSDKTYIANVYKRYRFRAGHWLNKLVSLTFAILVILVFLQLHLRTDLSYWWGSEYHGRAGIVFALIEGITVYFGSQAILQITWGSFMLARLFSRGLTLRPFHPDGCNGLEPLGRQIFILWVFAICLSTEIIVTLFLGYLGIEHTQVSWLLALFVTLCLPVIAIIPLLAAVRAIYRARASELRKLESGLMKMYKRARDAIASDSGNTTIAMLSSLNDLLGTFVVVRDANVWPFNPKALTLVVVIFGLQVVLTASQLLSLFR